MARKLFGTDGVRGVAGEVLTADLALSLGRAATAEIAGERPRVLVIRDTRESGEMLEAALAAGVAAAGGEVLLGGVLPTPAAPLLIARSTASTSPRSSPRRTTRTATTGSSSSAATASSSATQTELAIETRLEGPTPAASRIGRVRALHGTQEDYLRGLHDALRRRSTSAACAVLLDCANGATYRVGPEIFRRLGADVTVIAEQPDGRNINDGVGSTHVEALADAPRRPRHRVRVRRRRRPRAGDGPHRRGRRRRRAARARDAAPQGARASR